MGLEGKIIGWGEPLIPDGYIKGEVHPAAPDDRPCDENRRKLRRGPAIPIGEVTTEKPPTTDEKRVIRHG